MAPFFPRFISGCATVIFPTCVKTEILNIWQIVFTDRLNLVQREI